MFLFVVTAGCVPVCVGNRQAGGGGEGRCSVGWGLRQTRCSLLLPASHHACFLHRHICSRWSARRVHPAAPANQSPQLKQQPSTIVTAHLNCVLLSRQTKCVPAHGVQHVEPTHALVPSHNVCSCVALRVAHVQARAAAATGVGLGARGEGRG